MGAKLRKKGYYTAFFHGAENGSMGFEAFSRATGFQDYYGRTEYNNDDDFDGRWAIWDEEFSSFLQMNFLLSVNLLQLLFLVLLPIIRL